MKGVTISHVARRRKIDRDRQAKVSPSHQVRLMRLSPGAELAHCWEIRAQGGVVADRMDQQPCSIGAIADCCRTDCQANGPFFWSLTGRFSGSACMGPPVHCVCAPSPLKLAARADGSVAIFFTLLDFSLAPEGAGAELADVTSTLSNQSQHGLFTVLGTWPLDTRHDPTISHDSSGGRTRVASSSPLPRAPE